MFHFNHLPPNNESENERAERFSVRAHMIAKDAETVRRLVSRSTVLIDSGYTYIRRRLTIVEERGGGSMLRIGHGDVLPPLQLGNDL